MEKITIVDYTDGVITLDNGCKIDSSLCLSDIGWNLRDPDGKLKVFDGMNSFEKLIEAIGKYPITETITVPPHQEEKRKKTFEKINSRNYVDLLDDLLEMMNELKAKGSHLIVPSEDPLEMLVRRRNEFDPETYIKDVEGYELKPCPFCGRDEPVVFFEYAPEYDEGWHGKHILFELGCCFCDIYIHASANTVYVENNRERLLQDMVDTWNARAGEYDYKDTETPDDPKCFICGHDAAHPDITVDGKPVCFECSNRHEYDQALDKANARIAELEAENRHISEKNCYMKRLLNDIEGRIRESSDAIMSHKHHYDIATKAIEMLVEKLTDRTPAPFVFDPRRPFDIVSGCESLSEEFRKVVDIFEKIAKINAQHYRELMGFKGNNDD